jgi:hypothetical protein
MPSNTCCGVETECSLEAALAVPRQIAVAIATLVGHKQIRIGFTTPILKKKIVPAMKNGCHLRMTKHPPPLRYGAAGECRMTKE